MISSLRGSVAIWMFLPLRHNEEMKGSSYARSVREGRLEQMKVTRGRGNVFRDLGFGPEEAASLLYRADLVIALTDLIKKRRWTQAAAAKMMGVTQPRISD